MLIATFNINNVNRRLPNLLAWLGKRKPDVVCLQELKAAQADFPREALEKAGYDAVWRGQKTWNGVAILSRVGAPVLTRDELPGDPDDSQSRYIEAAVKGVLIASIYAPNGNPVPGPKFDYKLAWLARLHRHATALRKTGAPVVLAGDYNVAPTDIDIYPTKSWDNDALIQPESRLAFRKLVGRSWTDALRHLHPTSASTPSGTTSVSAGRRTRACGSTISCSAVISWVRSKVLASTRRSAPGRRQRSCAGVDQAEDLSGMAGGRSVAEPAFLQIAHILEHHAVLAHEHHFQKVADDEGRDQDFDALRLDVWRQLLHAIGDMRIVSHGVGHGAVVAIAQEFDVLGMVARVRHPDLAGLDPILLRLLLRRRDADVVEDEVRTSADPHDIAGAADSSAASVASSAAVASSGVPIVTGLPPSAQPAK